VTDWAGACPRCRASIGPLSGDLVACSSCTHNYLRTDGIWHLIRPEQEATVNRFLQDYTAIRRAEGRGSDGPDYYRQLPQPFPDDPLAWQWAMRAATWSHVVRRVLPELGPGLQVLDLGAGAGWLSNRMSLLGHVPMAIDLSVDDLDGLGAARHFDANWFRVRAEFDHLPLADAQVDLVVFNASFHYSTNYATTLGEARRILRPGGHVLVLDSPVYRHDASGKQMVAERHADFERRFGTRSDTVPAVEYLTESMLTDLSRDLGISWSRSIANYGWRWRMRPLKARLRGKREPSRFITLLGSFVD
jgi:ubiquinone/menaquinone biosynthesis C-methylase UbiE